MVAVPLATPVTKPVLASTVATPILSLLQVLIVLMAVVPLLLSWVVKPAQTEVVPLMVPALGASNTSIPTRLLLIQPLAVTR